MTLVVIFFKTSSLSRIRTLVTALSRPFDDLPSEYRSNITLTILYSEVGRHGRTNSSYDTDDDEHQLRTLMKHKATKYSTALVSRTEQTTVNPNVHPGSQMRSQIQMCIQEVKCR